MKRAPIWTAGRRDPACGPPRWTDGEPPRVGELERRPCARSVDGRPGRGGHAARARRLAGVALRGRAARAPGGARRAHARGDARAGARAGDEPARDGRGGGQRAARDARGPGRDRPGARPARRGRGHAPDRARRGGRGLARRPLPVPAREPARAGAARADVRAARARRGAGSGARRARAERHARAHPGAAGAVGELAVHARHRQRPGLRAHAGLPGLPAHRHPARDGQLRRLRRVDRRPDPLRRDPGADVHLVGRAAAAAARHARGAGDGRPDPDPRHRGARRARPVPGAAGGARRAGPRRSRPR